MIAATALFGREADVQALAHAMPENFTGGVRNVDLASLTDAQQVLPALATALGLGVGPAAALDAVVKILATNPLLLVVDNCEHLLRPVAELVATLLNAATKLKVLSTSQEALNLRYEKVYRLGTLAIPNDNMPLQEARLTGALALFDKRARAADQRFVIDADNVGIVTDICRQLDGIALAIELAAARVRLLGVEGLRSRLHEKQSISVKGIPWSVRRFGGGNGYGGDRVRRALLRSQTVRLLDAGADRRAARGARMGRWLGRFEWSRG